MDTSVGRFLAGERHSQPGAQGLHSHGWTPEQAARFDASLAELDRALADELKRVAAAVSASPASRDPLYSIYQAKIDLLSRAAVGGQL